MIGQPENRTPLLVGRSRFRIIHAMLDGKITPAEAVRLQGLPNMELLMVDSEHEITTEEAEKEMAAL